ncbi:MAG TPA: HNH endonuclease [Pseudomonas sp.]|nr:HNH endonuclease [Pseudomonas sp.]
MIKLKKSAIPDVLKDNAAKWTTAVLEKLKQSIELAKSEKNKYNHPSIKEALVKETNGKCAYCESKILHITYGDIEHITPKKIRPELWFDWDNLTLACDICNTKKSSKEHILDPYENDPADRLLFIGPTIWPAPGDEISKYTIEELALNREALTEKRQEKIEYLMLMLDVIAKTNHPQLVETLKSDFKSELTDEKEFSGLARCLASELTAKGFLT